MAVNALLNIHAQTSHNNLVFSECTDLGWEARTSQVHVLFLAKQLLFIMWLAPSTGTPSQPLLEGATKGSLQPRQAAVAQWHGWEEESCLSPVSPLRTTTSHFPATGTPSNSTQTHTEEAWRAWRAWKAHFQWSDRCLCQLHRKDFMLYIHLPGDGTSYFLCQEHSYIPSFDYQNSSILVNWRLQNSTIYEEENLYCLK